MKTVAIWSAIAVAAFVAMGFQMGLFRHEAPDKIEETVPTVEEKPAPPRVIAKFPDDLAPAAQARPVPAAAPYKTGNGPHPLVFLALNGVLHPWQDQVREDWAAESVSTTELVVVLGNQRKQFISHHTYPSGAPPITRWQFELEISVIEAKTGRILANRLFRNDPRPLMRVEAWETTAIGRTVTMHQVFAWVSRTARFGFPDNATAPPIVSVMD